MRDERGAWKALVASTLRADFKGHEEQPGREMFSEEEGPVWYKARMARRAAIEADPYVVISTCHLYVYVPYWC